MMENECQNLDVKIEIAQSGQNLPTESLNKQLQLCQQLQEVEKDIEKLKNEFDFINTSFITQVLHNPDNKAFIKNMYQDRLDEIQKDIREKVIFSICPCLWLTLCGFVSVIANEHVLQRKSIINSVYF